MIKVGERAPEFTLPDETGTDRSLTELLSFGALVLYFYPADFTPGCTRQACLFSRPAVGIRAGRPARRRDQPAKPAIPRKIQGRIQSSLRFAVG